MSLEGLDVAVQQIESHDPAKMLEATHSIEKLILSNPKQFASTQDSYAYNIAGRLALQLNAIFSPDYPAKTATALLRLLRGVCLLHRPSREVFNNDVYLNLILQMGIKHKTQEIQIASIETLVAVLVRQVESIRRFEKLKGLKVVCDIFKQSRATTQVKLAILQFLFFYLIPETKVPDQNQTVPRKTTQDKQLMLGKYLSNVDGLVRELETNRPFGNNEIEW